MNLHRTRRRSSPQVPGPAVAGWAGADALADLGDDLRRQDPELAAALAGFDARSLPLWARPLTWWIGSVVVIAVAVLAVLSSGLALLGVVPLVVLPAALALMAAGTPGRTPR